MKGRADSVSEARDELGLGSLEDRQKKSSTVFTDPNSSKWGSTPISIQSPWWDYWRQGACNCSHSSGCQRRFYLYIN